MNKLTIYISMSMMIVLLSNGICLAEDKAMTKNKASNTDHLNFDNIPNGRLPAEAQVFTGSWVVRAEQGAPSAPNALCQTGIADYPAIVLKDRPYSDVEVSTGFKTLSGKEDQAAGIIFRVQDKDNYYIMRANALEDNVILFKYVRGSRSSIKEGSVKVAKGVWQELRVYVRGSLIRGYLNGKLVVEATDNTFSAGKVGLWTKADSNTCFDNVLITTLSR